MSSTMAAGERRLLTSPSIFAFALAVPLACAALSWATAIGCRTWKHDPSLSCCINANPCGVLLDACKEGYGDILSTAKISNVDEGFVDQCIVKIGTHCGWGAQEWQRVLQTQRASQQAYGLVEQASGNAGTHKNRIGPAVWCDTFLDHRFENTHSTPQILVGATRLHQICVHMNVGLKVVLLCDLLHER